MKFNLGITYLVSSCVVHVFVFVCASRLFLCRQVLAEKHWKQLKKDCSERREKFFSKVVISDMEQSVPATVPTIDDARAKRRRLYKLASEKKPPFPVMHRNFYSHVTENKEIVKALSLLSTCVQPLKPVNTISVCFERIFINCLQIS